MVRVRTLVLFGLALSTTVAVADDEIRRGRRAVNYAHPDVVALVSAGPARAIHGYDMGTSWLVIERASTSTLEWQRVVRTATWNGAAVDLSAASWFRLDRIANNRLQFRAEFNGREPLQCTVDVDLATRPVTCVAVNARPDTPPPAPPPHVPTMAEIEALTKSCKAVFPYSTTDQRACLGHLEVVLKGPFWQSAVKIPGACNKVFPYSSTDSMKCIEHTKTARREPVDVMPYCQKNNPYSTTDAMKCIAEWLQK